MINAYVIWCLLLGGNTKAFPGWLCTQILISPLNVLHTFWPHVANFSFTYHRTCISYYMFLSSAVMAQAGDRPASLICWESISVWSHCLSYSVSVNRRFFLHSWCILPATQQSCEYITSAQPSALQWLKFIFHRTARHTAEIFCILQCTFASTIKLS